MFGGLTHSLTGPNRRSFDFRGRARRGEYWGFILWQLGFAPYIGVCWLLWMMVAPGTAGPNRYGDDPRSGAFDAALFE